MEMDHGARAWMFRHAQKNHWRVAAWYDLDDLIQDGYLHWRRVVQHYPDVVDRPHIMSLFKITYINHIHDLAKRRDRLPEVRLLDTAAPGTTLTESDLWDRILVDEQELSEFDVLISQAPDPIRKVLALLTSEDGCRRLRSQYRRLRGGIRETKNERLARLTGLSPEINFEQAFREYFAVV